MASDIIRNMPCNVEAEQYVLGAIIFDNECIPDVMSTLKAEEFYLEQHRVIYNAMISVQNKAEPIDFVTLKSQLGINFDTIGGIEYLTKIRLMVSTTSNLKYHIKIIKDKAVLRKLIAAGNDIASICYDQKDELPVILSESEKKLYDILQNKNTTELTHIKEVLADNLAKLEESQHFTEPPARYTEASLIKAMEEEGIGRPSTYAPTITTILSRNYISRKGKALHPTELGTVITDLMVEYFKDIVDIEFTANMEEKLDGVEEGTIDWVKVVSDFYGPFAETLKNAEDVIGKIKIEDEVSDVPCEKCGRMMVYKMGRFGKFLACPGFPECRNAKPIIKEAGANCPKCGSKLLVKKSKRGKTYYGCENNPTCEFMTWDTPLAQECPKCGGLLLENKFRGKKRVYCADEKCGYEENKEKKSK